MVKQNFTFLDSSNSLYFREGNESVQLLKLLTAILSEKQGIVIPEEKWTQIVQLADQHKLIPVFYKKLKNGYSETAQSKDMDSLKLKYEEKVYRALGQAVQMNQIARLFNNLKIEYCLLKGPFLSQQLYGDLISRQFTDLDILVSEAHFEKALRALKVLSFHGEETFYFMNESQRRFYLRYINDIGLRNPSGTLVELHWRLFVPGLVDKSLPEVFFNTTEFICIGEERIPGMTKICHLFYLIIHGYKHAWYRLSWLWDVVSMLRKLAPSEQEEVYQLFTAQKLTVPLYQALYLGHLLFGLDISYYQTLNAKFPKREISFALNAIIKGKPDHSYAGMMRNLLYNIRLKTSCTYRKNIILPYLTHYRDWEVLPLPAKLFPFYFILHPFIVIFRRMKTK